MKALYESNKIVINREEDTLKLEGVFDVFTTADLPLEMIQDAIKGIRLIDCQLIERADSSFIALLIHLKLSSDVQIQSLPQNLPPLMTLYNQENLI